MLTVLILAAGYGRRMGHFSRMVNKGLIPYDNKPLISHIIERFDQDTKFVIACGHMGQQVKDYVSAVHTDKQIIYVDIDDYAEGSTGPATTIQKCSPHLTAPFMWLSCDTVFDFDYKSKMNHNWIGVYPVDSAIAKDYCWIQRDGDTITDIYNKQPSTTAVDAFIGLMYCRDNTYLDNLRAKGAREAYQGFDDNLELHAHTVRDWKDFGTYDKWVELSRGLKEVSFPKPDEIFYQDNNKIVKFTTNSTLTDKKANRALLNPNCMPKGIRRSGQFLVYDYVEGDIVYNKLTPALFAQLLDWSEQNLWRRKWFPDTDQICRDFYQEKTLNRLNQFRVKYKDWSDPTSVNNVPTLSINDYLNKIDWDWLCRENEWAFIHGDFQFENIIAHDRGFTCIDWRTDFGGSSYGDLYYDLAKMLGGIMLNYQSVKKGDLVYEEQAELATLNYCGLDDALDYRQQLRIWVEQHNLNWDKVELLVPIIYLNMSPLHDAPFDKYLFALAQLRFAEYFNESRTSNSQ